MRKLFFLFSLFFLSQIGFSQNKDWEKIIVTKNPEDVKGLTRLKEVSAEAARFYGKQSKLREEATKKLKQEAAKLGATAILLSVDEFAMSPVNNVSMVGMCFTDGSVPVKENADTETSTASNEDIILTKNPDDIKGRTRLGDVKGEASQFFGMQSRLRKDATKKMKEEAAKLGATIILVTTDSFTMTPVNNVVMEGTAYK
jgi:hypothetical protein